MHVTLKGTRLTPHLTMNLIGFSYIASFSVISPILSIYLKDVIRAPVEIIGLVTATFFIASAFAKFLLGILGGGKKIINLLFSAFLIFSVCPMLYPLVNQSLILLVVRAIQGFAYALIGTASIILAALSISRVERDQGVGTYTAFLSLGFLAGPTITTISIPLFGVSDTFYLAGLMGFIGIYASYVLYRKFSKIDEDWQIMSVTVEKERLRTKISAVLRNKMFETGFIGVISFYLLFGVMLTYAPLYAKENFGFSDELVSILFLLYYVATTFTRFSIGKIVGKLSKTILMVLTVGFTSVLSLVLAVVKNNLGFIVVFALIGAIQGVIFPVGSMLIAEHVHPSRNTLASSLYMMGIDVGQGLAPLITAGVTVKYGLEHGFTVSAVVSAIATVLVVWLIRRKTD